MNARKKLNSAHLNGAAIIAGLAGAVSGSWIVFFSALALVVAGACYVGHIRPGRRRG